MEKELFKKIEGRLYRYFNSLNIIDTLKIEIEELKRQREIIRKDIQETNIFIEADLNMSVSYDEKVQTSSSRTSYVENQLIKQIKQLEENLTFTNLRILKKKSKSRCLEREVISLKPIINTLDHEEKKFIKLKYRDKKSMEYVSVELFGGVRMTAYRKRKDLINDIYMKIK